MRKLNTNYDATHGRYHWITGIIQNNQEFYSSVKVVAIERNNLFINVISPQPHHESEKNSSQNYSQLRLILIEPM